jgi:hypothetical protein
MLPSQLEGVLPKLEFGSEYLTCPNDICILDGRNELAIADEGKGVIISDKNGKKYSKVCE